MTKITKTEYNVLCSIAQYRAARNISPTICEISEMMDFCNPNDANKHIESLNKECLITRESVDNIDFGQSILITKKGASMLKDAIAYF